jgi:hypothetical protein
MQPYSRLFTTVTVRCQHQDLQVPRANLRLVAGELTVREALSLYLELPDIALVATYLARQARFVDLPTSAT